MRKITTLIAACFIAGTGFAQEQREWQGGQTAGDLWDHTTTNWLDPNSSLPFPKSFAAGNFAIFTDKVKEGSETVTVVGEMKTAGVTYKASKDITLKRNTTTNFTTDFLSGDGTLIHEGTGTFAIGVENKLTGGSIVKSGVLRMEEASITGALYNPFGAKVVLEGGTVDFGSKKSTDKQYIQMQPTTIEIPAGQKGTVRFAHFTYFNGIFEGAGELTIALEGERGYIGEKTIANGISDFSKYTNKTINLEYYDSGSGKSKIGLLMFVTDKTFTPDSPTFEGADSTFANKSLVLGPKAGIATESGTIGYVIGELKSDDETSQVFGYRSKSNSPKPYWIVGGLNTDVVFKGRFSSPSTENYNALGFIKVGTGTYTFTNNDNLMQVIGLEIRDGKILVCDDVLRGLHSGGIGGNVVVKENGVLGGTGRIQTHKNGMVDVYGKLEPGANGIGTLMISDSLRTEPDATAMAKQNLNLYPGSVSEFEIKSKDAYDKVEVYGNVSFKTGEGKPTIKVVIPGAYNIQDGDQFEILSAFTCNDEAIDFNIEYPTIQGVTWSYDIVKLGEEENNQNPRIPEGSALKFKLVIKAAGSGVGIQDQKVVADVVTLYPNPTYSDFKVSANDVEINSIEVYNIQGQLVKVQVANESEVTVGVSEIPAGVYIVKVYTTSGIAVQKLVKK